MVDLTVDNSTGKLTEQTFNQEFRLQKSKMYQTIQDKVIYNPNQVLGAPVINVGVYATPGDPQSNLFMILMIVLSVAVVLMIVVIVVSVLFIKKKKSSKVEQGKINQVQMASRNGKLDSSTSQLNAVTPVGDIEKADHLATLNMSQIDAAVGNGGSETPPRDKNNSLKPEPVNDKKKLL